MFPQQQVIGVNERLGNVAVKDMQGTTRAIFDSLPVNAQNNYRFFDGVQNRIFPDANLNQNRFEPGESLAIQSIAILGFSGGGFGFPAAGYVNLYIGNQRVLKDFPMEYANVLLGTSNRNTASGIIYLETPIVIPPQIEFYIEYIGTVPGQGPPATRAYCILQGMGTLLNTQNTY